MQRGIVWIVDDDSSIRWVLERALTGAGLNCATFDSANEVLEALATKTPDVLLSDIRMPGMDGLALLKQIKQRHPMLPVIIMTAHSDLDAAVSAYQQGAFDYLPKPFDIDEAVALVERAISHYQEQQQPRNQPVSGPTTDIIGEAPAMQDVFRIIGRLSRSSISVLINGESGTGKELVAHALHRHSPRAKAPFIALNMAAIPKDLIESELFGHEKGAFTGANQIRQGRFEQADGGTLFLDEIGDMPLDVQTRLLRVLADGQFYRVGGYAPVKVDVRIIAATHQNLELRVHEGKFREDLFHRLNVIIMTAHSDLDAAVSAYQQGAFDYLPKPFDIDEAVALVERAISHYQEQQQPRNQPVSGPTTDIIGEAPAMQDVFRIIGRLSRSSISVLINGESGTGKELVAHALHRHSPRAKAPFIALNMAAIPKDLIESELFGHEKGAFTGANQIRQGRFEQADGGTLFLDEIGDMPLDVQTRLLRVLADGQFYRVGGYAPVKVDVRIIAATHQNLELRVHEGKFREDLFHRLNVIRVHLPPLRERREDIPRLARYFLQVAARELGVEAKILHPETETALTRLHWSGNVRQLENTCRWLTVMAAGQEVLIQDLPPELFETSTPENPVQSLPDSWATLLAQWADRALRSGHQNLLSEAQPEMERTLLTTALRHTQGHKQEAARLLGWGRNTLTRKLKELGME
ncbi:nitrogen regulation protein NR(I) [Erwinia sp. MYb535]|uniref:nitrogen regulation protein NR(I) n=1 Tax=Erwinia sp. MYb535 TaxID=2745309 RepID=UPI00403F1C95